MRPFCSQWNFMFNSPSSLEGHDRKDCGANHSRVVVHIDAEAGAHGKAIGHPAMEVALHANRAPGDARAGCGGVGPRLLPGAPTEPNSDDRRTDPSERCTIPEQRANVLKLSLHPITASVLTQRSHVIDGDSPPPGEPPGALKGDHRQAWRRLVTASPREAGANCYLEPPRDGSSRVGGIVSAAAPRFHRLRALLEAAVLAIGGR
jgi:hypothetical protein